MAELNGHFKDKVGTGQGIMDMPDYDVGSVAIILRQTDKAVLVHESLGVLDRLAGKGTGEIGSDRVSAYTPEEFKKKFDGQETVTLSQYRADFDRINQARFVTSSGTPIVNAADDMDTRLREIPKDMSAYEQSLKIMNDALKPSVPTR